MSLLEKALKVKTARRDRNEITEDDCELVAAWVTGEISTTQLATARGGNNSGAQYSYIAGVIRYMFKNGMLAFRKGK